MTSAVWQGGRFDESYEHEAAEIVADWQAASDELRDFALGSNGGRSLREEVDLLRLEYQALLLEAGLDEIGLPSLPSE